MVSTAHIYIYIYMYTRMCICVYRNICAYGCIQLRTYVRIYTHIYIYSYDGLMGFRIKGPDWGTMGSTLDLARGAVTLVIPSA